MTKKKILVVAYSRSGITDAAGKKIAEALGADYARIIEKDKDRSGIFGWIGAGFAASKDQATEINPLPKNGAEYDLVVVGTPIWAGKMAPAVRTYIRSIKTSGKPLAFFTTAGGSGPEKINASFETESGSKPLALLNLIKKDIASGEELKKKITVFAETLLK